MTVQTTSFSPAQPQQRTSVSRGLIKMVLITFIVVVVGFVFLRRIAGVTPESAAEARAKKEEKARAAKAEANPFSVQRLIANQLKDRLVSLESAPESALQQSGDPKPDLAPPQVAVDAQRIDERRAGETTQETDLSAVEIGAWETQESSNDAALRPSLANAPGAPGSSGQPAMLDNISNRGNVDPQQSRAGAIKTPLYASAAPSPYYIREGWIISAVIQQSLNTDAPGTFRAMVTTNVYDSVHGKHLLIEAGSMLSGELNTDIADGQSRILMSVNRMDFPSGGRIALGGWDISDRTGASGINAQVDDHFWQRFGSAFGVAAVAALAGRYDNSRNVTINVGGGGSNGGSSTSTLTGTAGQALSDTVRQMLQRNQTIKRSLTLEPADKINIVVARDLVLDPNIVRSY